MSLCVSAMGNCTLIEELGQTVQYFIYISVFKLSFVTKWKNYFLLWDTCLLENKISWKLLKMASDTLLCLPANVYMNNCVVLIFFTYYM